MCTLYTLRLSAWEVRNLMQHYKLVGREWEEVIGARNDAQEFYPNYEAPVVVARDGQRTVETMRWGFPPPPGVGSKAPVVNVRNTASAYWRPSIANKAQRCIVPAAAFAEPDRNTSKPVVIRWFRRPAGEPFFFAGIWREWEGDRGTKAKPNVGRHKLYSFLTTAPNGIVEPIHNKAMPVLLMTPADVERWLEGTAEEALELQKPAPDDAILMDPSLEKKAA
ncbi:Putative SOS response-associated peptidase YedK [Rhodospirillales bacterium URHD0017]|nr:Putative SOS response-associated peptidase YedK [Rhodospirillales bacterium URHD0017]